MERGKAKQTDFQLKEKQTATDSRKAVQALHSVGVTSDVKLQRPWGGPHGLHLPMCSFSIWADGGSLLKPDSLSFNLGACLSLKTLASSRLSFLSQILIQRWLRGDQAMVLVLAMAVHACRVWEGAAVSTMHSRGREQPIRLPLISKTGL